MGRIEEAQAIEALLEEIRAGAQAVRLAELDLIRARQERDEAIRKARSSKPRPTVEEVAEGAEVTRSQVYSILAGE
jgi:hypothetical protein